MRKNGFTLIELLVVISIMSILTVITVSQFGTAQKRSRDVARKADLNSLSKALLNYYADYGVLPEASENGKLVMEESEINWGGEFDDETGYIYMKVMPRENSSNMPDYCYRAVGTPPDKFALFSGLENEEDEEYNKYNEDSDYTPGGCSSSSYNFVVFSSNAGYADFD